MSKNEEKSKSIPQEEVQELNISLALDKIKSLQDRVSTLESRLEKIDHYTAIQGQNMNVNSRNRRGRTGV